uniref:Uncharacterized protein n=1 Tax=viral metagenome TaxID=1070528 RepID=A0A6M3JSU7_9ZZZZ
MITWRDRHRNGVVVSSTINGKNLKVTIDDKFKFNKWFLTAIIYHETGIPKLKLCDETPLSSSLIKDAKIETFMVISDEIEKLNNEMKALKKVIWEA